MKNKEKTEGGVMRSLFHTSDSDSDSSYDETLSVSRHVEKIKYGEGELQVVYHLDWAAPGHGDALWNSCRVIARLLLNAPPSSPYLPLSPPSIALEFGSGAALPSMCLMKLGCPLVLSTDQPGSESTFAAIEKSARSNADTWGVPKTVAALPLQWGAGSGAVLERTGGRKVDLLIASDCIYDPSYHSDLLESAGGLISKDGTFVVGYSLHNNVPEGRVEKFFDLARGGGWKVREERTERFERQNAAPWDDSKTRGDVYVKVLVRERGGGEGEGAAIEGDL
ncbi:hypothetical protein TrRE_jg11616 [Triparma retinervis]|uniref:Nicotinamide N-methyltransferase n=1 Tax=Triparma retinervis TaxID=2557542 RepID=A0A9W7F5P4_9STRA|nr:hypothetical protein TrRE_jg11616 [Triparma retinervis]